MQHRNIHWTRRVHFAFIPSLWKLQGLVAVYWNFRMLTELAIVGLIVFIARVAKWIIDPYLAWKKNYQARGQEY